MVRIGAGLTARMSVLVAAMLISGAAVAQESADTIYRGGPIITVDEKAPRAEAVAVKDGRIVAVGSLSDVMQHRGEETELFELEGRAMLPGLSGASEHALPTTPERAALRRRWANLIRRVYEVDPLVCPC